MMKLPSLTKIPQHRRFNYQPLKYDPDKEEFRERVAAAKRKYANEQDSEVYIRERKIQFERKTLQRRFEFSLQLYVILFLGFDVFLLYFLENMSNTAWGIVLGLQVLAMVLKVKLDKRK